jgi:cell division protein FtsB
LKSAYSSFSKKRNTTLEKDKYELLLNNLEEKKLHLENKIEHLKTDRGIEEELRKRFNITREGEQIIKIIENQE